MSSPRESILSRLRQQQAKEAPNPAAYRPNYGWTKTEKVERFTRAMSKVRGEVVDLRGQSWVNWLNSELPKRSLKNILVGTGVVGDQLVAQGGDDILVSRYDRPIENWKSELFNQIDASVTGTLAGIAETGSLVIWPDANEPRLMSLAPPVHIAILDSDTLYESFADIVIKQDWKAKMPTNALLISGPSKTADIEQTLAYGIHGPQQLIILVI